MRSASRVAVAMAAALVLIMSAVPASADPPATSPGATDMVNGTVRAIAQVGNDIWIGGSFTQVLDHNRNVIRAAGGLAVFDAAGQLDTSVTLPVLTRAAGAATVFALSEAPNGTLYVGGAFDTVNGTARKNLAAIDPTSGSLLGFKAGVGVVSSIDATSDAIYVGTDKLLSLLPGGGPTPGYTPPLLSTDASLRSHVTLPNVRHIVDAGDTIVIACQCDAITDSHGTHDVKAVAEIDASSGDLTSWTPANLPETSAAFGIDVLIHNFPGTSTPTVFLAAGGSDFTAAFDLHTGAQHWREDTSGSSQAITWYQDDLIVGGHYDWTQAPGSGECGKNTRPNLKCYLSPHLVALNPTTGFPVLVGGVPWNPGICCHYNGVWTLLADDNGTSLHVGGEFTQVGTATWTYDGTDQTYSMKGGVKQDFYTRFDTPVAPQTLTAHVTGSGEGTVSSNPAGIKCPGTCAATFAGNTTVTLTAAPSTGSSFTGWSGDCTGTGACVVLMNAAQSVTATFGPSLATCGKVLFVSDRQGAGDIFSMNPDGSGVTDLTNNAAPDAGPAWSPTCDRIAFSSTRGGGTSHLFVMKANGTGVTQVTNGAGSDSQPTWSPAGDKLAFVSNRDDNLELYVVRVDGGGLTRITNNHWADVQPDWSPKGDRIVFASNRFGPMNLFTVTPGGGGRTRLTHGTRPTTQPEWSPNASRIVFVSGASGTPQVWVMKANGTGVRRLVRDAKTDTHPTWAPGGSRVAYASTKSGNADIWIVNDNGTGAVNVTRNPARDSGPAWR